MKYKLYDRVILTDGRLGTIVDIVGTDYIVDIGWNTKSFDTIMVPASAIRGASHETNEVHFCPVYGKEISMDLCYESLQCLKGMFHPSSVMELSEIKDLKEAANVCGNCDFSMLS